LIVRRGCDDKLAFLRASFLRRKHVTVIPDRRSAERRRAPQAVLQDRRRAERRREPPPSWELADYVLVPAPPA
jgi:hypothetical protein